MDNEIQKALDSMPEFTHKNTVQRRAAFNEWTMVNYYLIKRSLEACRGEAEKG